MAHTSDRIGTLVDDDRSELMIERTHSSSLGGFSSAARGTGRAGPAYARSAIGELKAQLGAGALVLDVGAGTGSLSGQLTRAGLRVIAVDRRPDALGQVRRSLPGVGAVCAAAEHLPVAASSVDAVAVGTAFHEFDAALVLLEAARVIMPGGTLALLWNRDDGGSRDWAALVAGAERFTPALAGRHEESTPPGASAARPTELWTWTLTS